MSEGFNNPVSNAIGTLVRVALQSFGFITGSTGWQIKRNGNAEFNNAIVRGEIDIGPASPNPRITDGPVPATLIAASADFTWSTARVYWFNATDYYFEQAIGVYNIPVPASFTLTASGTYSAATGVLFNTFEQNNPAGTLLYGSAGYNSQLLSWTYRHGVMLFATDASIQFLGDGSQLNVGAWVEYGPTGTNTFVWAGSGGNPTIGNGTISAKYQYLNKHTVIVKFHIMMGTTTTRGAGNYSFSLPVPTASGGASSGDTGTFWINDSGVAIRTGSVMTSTSSAVQLFINASGGPVTAATLTGILNGTDIRATYIYEV